jgi:hypothetical protein
VVSSWLPWLLLVIGAGVLIICEWSVLCSYISLIKRDFGEMAKEFWKTFEAGPPELMSCYGDELRELSMFTNRDQLRAGADLLSANHFV